MGSKAALACLYFWSVEQVDVDTFEGRSLALGGGVLVLVASALSSPLT